MRGQLACRAFASFVSTEVGGRWKTISRRNPTRRIYEDLHAEAEPTRPDKDPCAHRARAFALSKLIPLRTANRTFPTISAIADALQFDETRVAYWKEHYPCCAHLIKKLLAPSS